jgi:hypothetical protein
VSFFRFFPRKILFKKNLGDFYGPRRLQNIEPLALTGKILRTKVLSGCCEKTAAALRLKDDPIFAL